MQLRIHATLLLIGISVYGFNSQAQERSTKSAPQSAVRDIALQNSNTLLGQIIDTQGTPQRDSQVFLLQRGKVVRSSRTDASGRFYLRDLRAGVYQVETTSGGGIYRLWASKTAPPAAKKGVLIVRQSEIVRGQMIPGIDRRTIVGGALATGLIGGSVYWAIDYHDTGS